MIIESTGELRDFTVKKLKKSGMIAEEVARKLQNSRQAVSHALTEGERSSSSRNGMRIKILELLGYKVNVVFDVNRIRKK